MPNETPFLLSFIQKNHFPLEICFYLNFYPFCFRVLIFLFEFACSSSPEGKSCLLYSPNPAPVRMPEYHRLAVGICGVSDGSTQPMLLIAFLGLCIT